MALDGGRADSQSEGDLLVSFAEETRASTFFSAAVSLEVRFVRVIFVPFSFHHQTNHTCAAILEYRSVSSHLR